MNENHEPSVQGSVLEKIRRGAVRMRPRSHFILISAFWVVGVLLVFVSLLYLASLGVFFLRQSGVWFVPAFGIRGWFDLLRAAPLFLIALVAAFAILLDRFVRRYSFGYRIPVVISLGAILALIVVGGVAVGLTPLHPRIAQFAEQGPGGPLEFWYHSLRAPAPDDVYRGVVVKHTPEGFVIISSAGTSTILLTPRTRLPYGEDFEAGDMIIVVGDRVSTDTIRAFGVRVIQDDGTWLH